MTFRVPVTPLSVIELKLARPASSTEVRLQHLV